MTSVANLVLALLIFFSSSIVASAQVSTPTVGFVNSTIAPSTSPGLARITPFSPVMLEAPEITGSAVGSISAVTSNSISVSSAGWTVNGLSAGQSYIQLTSGTQEGLILRVVSNTSDTATIDTFGLNVASAGVSVGDTFRMVVGETLLSMFGTGSATPTENIVLGGTSSQFSNRAIDFVVALDTTQQLRAFYFDTTVGQWRRTGSSSNQGNVPIPPYSGVLYNRLANLPITLSQTGTVPSRPIKYIIPATGSVFLGRFFPQDGTVASYALTSLPGWNNTSQSGITPTLADKFVTTDASGSLRAFFFNGTNWIRTGSGSSQNNSSVPATGAGYTIRIGAGSPQILTVPLPYTL